MQSRSLLRTTFNVMKTFYRFSTEASSTPATQQTKEKTVVETQEETPIHLRPYNKSKFEVPSTKLKYSTGYALLDIEPMPRAKIMKICYIVLDKLKDIPSDAMYRTYTEEKLKYIMKQTDEISDIRTLEETFGFESIEMFIQSLHTEIRLVDHMKVSKPWEAREEDAELLQFLKTPVSELKHQKHVRADREKVQFIDK